MHGRTDSSRRAIDEARLALTDLGRDFALAYVGMLDDGFFDE